jgi:hypothetical protein
MTTAIGGPRAAAPFEAYAYEDRFQAPLTLAGKEGPPRRRRRRIARWSSSFPSKERTLSAYPIRFSKRFLEVVFSEVLRSSPKLVFKHDVQEQGRRPRKEVGAVPETGRGIVVLIEALIPAQGDDGLSQALGLLLVAVAF